MRQRPDAECRGLIKRQGSRAGASSNKRAALISQESRIGGAGRNLETEQRLGYLLVKSRPRQKLPTQSRTVHLLDTPPSPPPPRLQLMAAAADARYELSLPSAAPPPDPASAPHLPDRIHGEGRSLTSRKGRRKRKGGALGSLPFLQSPSQQLERSPLSIWVRGP